MTKISPEVFIIPEGQHSPLGPSSGERWLECPGSVFLTLDMPDTDSDYSIEGTAAHSVTEWARMEGKDAEDYIGRHVDVELAQGGHARIVVDQEMADAVNDFVEYTDALGGEMLCEVKVCFDAWVDDAFGTADDIRIQSGWVPITDFKYGKGVQVFAKDNTQLKLYALGVFQDYGWMYDIKGFNLAVHQPRLNHIDEWSISLLDLLKWADEEAVPGAKLALTKNAPFKPGKWCQFCKAKATCKTRAKEVYETLYENDFDDIGPDESPVKNINLLTNDQVALLLPMLGSIKSFAAELDAHAYSLLGKGEELTHPILGKYKLVAGRSNRVWAESAEVVAEKVLESDPTIERKDLYTSKFKGPAAVEKLIGNKHELIVGEGSLVRKPPGAPKMVPGTDPRKALEVQAEDDFDDLDDKTSDFE